MNISQIVENPFILDPHISSSISPNDQMHSGSDSHYFSCGRDAIRKICGFSLMQDHKIDKILDFGCGYGRVTRYLRAAYPNSEITVSDVMRPAVDFCSDNFNAKPHYSNTDLNSIDVGKKFSLIWSGSLMTHFDESQAIKLINLFERHLDINGLVVFTTHGRVVADKWKTGKWPYKLTKEKLIELSESFHSGDYSYSDYDHINGYGISITPLSWLMSTLKNHKSLRLITLMERGWDDHQDLTVLQNRPVLP